MRLIRQLQVPTVFFTLAFALVALGVSPTAVCCEVLLASVEQAEDCPHMAVDGHACPMHQAKPVDQGPGCLNVGSCSTFDPLLAGLVVLTGAMPEDAPPSVAEVLVRPLVPDTSVSAVSFEPQPHTPPPRV